MINRGLHSSPALQAFVNNFSVDDPGTFLPEPTADLHIWREVSSLLRRGRVHPSFPKLQYWRTQHDRLMARVWHDIRRTPDWRTAFSPPAAVVLDEPADMDPLDEPDEGPVVPDDAGPDEDDAEDGGEDGGFNYDDSDSPLNDTDTDVPSSDDEEDLRNDPDVPEWGQLYPERYRAWRSTHLFDEDQRPPILAVGRADLTPADDFKYSFNPGTLNPEAFADSPALQEAAARGIGAPITKAATTKWLPPFRPPPRARKAYMNMLRALISAGILVRCQHPRQFNRHFIIMKNAAELRLIFNGKTGINARTPDPPHISMPALRFLPRNIGRNSWVCKVDISHAYYTMALRKALQPYTAISTSLGPLMFTRAPMGFDRSAFFLQSFLKLTLKGLKTTYHGDDIQCWGDSYAECMALRDHVCSLLEAAGFVVKTVKLTDPSQRADILGIEIDLVNKSTRPGGSFARHAADIFNNAAMRSKDLTAHDYFHLLGLVAWASHGDFAFKPLFNALIIRSPSSLAAIETLFRARTWVRIPVDSPVPARIILKSAPAGGSPFAFSTAADSEAVHFFCDATPTQLAVVTPTGTWVSRKRGTQIDNEADALRFALSLASAPTVIHSDAMTAIQAAYKGRSHNVALQQVASLFQVKRRNLPLAIVHVRSEDNIADAPSRHSYGKSDFGWTPRAA
jgi:hypothetical protein